MSQLYFLYIYNHSCELNIADECSRYFLVLELFSVNQKGIHSKLPEFSY